MSDDNAGPLLAAIDAAVNEQGDADIPKAIATYLLSLRTPSHAMALAMVKTPLPSPSDNRPLWLAIWQNGVDAALRELAAADGQE